MVAPAHELAARASATLAELSAYDVLSSGLPVPGYRKAAVSPVGHAPARTNRRVRTSEEVLWSIAGDDGAVGFACGQGLKYYDRGAAIYLPIEERPILRWGMVHRVGPADRWTRELVGIAREIGPIQLWLELELDAWWLRRLDLAG